MTYTGAPLTPAERLKEFMRETVDRLASEVDQYDPVDRVPIYNFELSAPIGNPPEQDDDEDEIPHGTATGYGNHHCRCPQCCAAAASYRKKRKAALAAKAAADPTALPHGTVRGYVDWSCRCSDCRSAYVAYRVEHPYRKARSEPA
jgi:hypothetical protein